MLEMGGNGEGKTLFASLAMNMRRRTDVWQSRNV